MPWLQIHSQVRLRRSTDPPPEPGTAPVDSGQAYVTAVVIGTLIAALMVLGILWLRPNADPLAILGAVGGLAVIVTAQAILFIKSHETGLRINGELSAWKAANTRAAHAEGVAQGTRAEQNRMATIKAVEDAAKLEHS